MSNQIETLRNKFNTAPKRGRRRFEVYELFGKKANGRLSNELARTDFPEFRRLQLLAKQLGLI